MPPKQKQIDEKLEQLIEKLEDKLAIFDENELKTVCLKHLIKMKGLLNEMEEVYSQIYHCLGLTYQDINYPS